MRTAISSTCSGGHAAHTQGERHAEPVTRLGALTGVVARMTGMRVGVIEPTSITPTLMPVILATTPVSAPISGHWLRVPLALRVRKRARRCRLS